ncbi:hypothetical protein T492DRAFT_1120201 [Pavlovales sp. CCMP2436]|nr:hypothetical protein T492DRAFT_1120201 [Pavlovales sp. CCMP2436]
MSRKKSHSKGGTKHATQLAACNRRASLEPVAQLEPTVAPPEPDQAPADMDVTNSAPRAEADAPALAFPSKPAHTTEEQRDMRRNELNAAAQRRCRALRKELLAEEAVAATDSSRARLCALTGGCARREGAPRGRAWRRRRRLGKMDERQAQVCAHTQHDSAKFGATILEIARDPASGPSDSRALLSWRTVAHR